MYKIVLSHVINSEFFYYSNRVCYLSVFFVVSSLTVDRIAVFLLHSRFCAIDISFLLVYLYRIAAVKLLNDDDVDEISEEFRRSEC